MTTLNPDHLRWLTAERRIDPSVVQRMGIYSVGRQADGSTGPDVAGRWLAFPFVAEGEEVNTKFRRIDRKEMHQRKGGEKILFNRDALLDPRLASGELPLVVTEGEVDALSFLPLLPTVVSVPDGAPPARDGAGRLIEVPKGADDIDIERDLKYGFIHRDWELLKGIKRIILAVDADEPGRRLQAELVRRLGPVRCSFIDFAEAGFKDANEVLVNAGQEALGSLLAGAKPFPVSGVYFRRDLPPRAPLEHGSTPWSSVDAVLKPYAPALLVVSGFANAGKSQWVNQLAAHLLVRHGWMTGIASFEMMPERVLDTMERAAAHSIPGARTDAIRRAKALVDEKVAILAPAPEAEEVTDVSWLLERASALVVQHGMKHLIVDPWNELETSKRRDESLTEYTGRALRDIHRWKNQTGCMVTIVAHPTKGAAAKDPEDLSLYDISDSAHFANKADLGVIIARLGDPAVDNISGVFVKKVRYQPDGGLIGAAQLTFDREMRIFV